MAGIRVAGSKRIDTIWDLPGISWLHRGVMPKVLAAMVVIIASVLTLVWVRMQVVELRFQVSRGRAELQSLQKEGDRLRLKVGRLKTPRRIEQIASETLNLTYPQPHQLRIMSESNDGLHVDGVEVAMEEAP